jgi:hypothetical protein
MAVGFTYGLCKNAYWDQIVTVSFIGRGNRSTRKKSTTCCMSLTDYHNTVVLSNIRWLSRTNHIYSEYTSHTLQSVLRTLTRSAEPVKLLNSTTRPTRFGIFHLTTSDIVYEDSFCFVNQKPSSVISYHLQKTLCKNAYWDQIVTVSFISRGNRRTRKNQQPVACHWYTTTYCCTE